jgi:hypothetical protein
MGGLTWSPGDNESPNLAMMFELLRADGGLTGGSHVQLWLSIAEPIGEIGEVSYLDAASGDADTATLVLTVQP